MSIILFLILWLLLIVGGLIVVFSTPIYTLLLLIVVNLLLSVFFWLVNLEFFSFIVILVIVGALAVYFLITVISYFSAVLFNRELKESKTVVIVHKTNITKNMGAIWVFTSGGFQTTNNINLLTSTWCTEFYSNYSYLYKPFIQTKLFLDSFISEGAMFGHFIYHEQSISTLLATFILLITLIGISFLFTGGVKKLSLLKFRKTCVSSCHIIKSFIQKRVLVLGGRCYFGVLNTVKKVVKFLGRYIIKEDIHALGTGILVALGCILLACVLSFGVAESENINVLALGLSLEQSHLLIPFFCLLHPNLGLKVSSKLLNKNVV